MQDQRETGSPTGVNGSGGLMRDLSKQYTLSGHVRSCHSLTDEFVENKLRAPVGADEDANIDVRRLDPFRLHHFQRQ